MKSHAAKLRLGKLERAILAVLLDHINYESGQARPGRERIKELSGYSSDRSLDRGLKSLRERQIIVPLAYLTGGRGRATCYGFCLPAFTKETPANGAGVNSSPQNENPRNPVHKPPQNSLETPAKNAVPTDRTIRTGERNTPRRGEGGPTACPAGSSSAFEQWDGQEPYSQYLSRKKRWENEEALRAAEIGETV